MSFLEGYLYMQRQGAEADAVYAGGGEVFNNGRTVDNLYAARAAGLLPRNVYMTAVGCDCAAYDVEPDGTARAALSPWDDGTAAADEFLGPYVTSQTGMDGAHNSRSTLSRASFPYGANLSPLKPGHRVMEFVVTMFATTHQGLDFGYEWLEDTLLTSACSVCEPSMAWMRSMCPRAGDMSEGLWQFNSVGLAEGPIWRDIEDDGLPGYVRQLSVTLYAGDPCRWGARAACLTGITLSTTRQCCTFGSQGRNFRSPTVSITTAANANPALTNGTNTEIQIWDASAVTGCSTFAGGTSAHGTITVLPILEGSTLVIDGRLRRVLFTNDGGVTWDDGSSYISSSAGFIDWDAYACEVSDDEVKIILRTIGTPALTTTATVGTYRRAGC